MPFNLPINRHHSCFAKDSNGEEKEERKSEMKEKSVRNLRVNEFCLRGNFVSVNITRANTILLPIFSGTFHILIIL